MPPADEPMLDNVAWHALRGPLSRFAIHGTDPGFIRMDPEVNIFSAVEKMDSTTWPRLEAEIGPSGFCGLFRDAIAELPPGWQEHFRGTIIQMVAHELPASRGLEVIELGANDVPDMLELTRLTEPAPFFERTIELGRYVGIRRQAQLIAMAGERFRLPGFVEISAVCTHPDARGQGLATEVTLNVAESIRADGDEAFLHVLDYNESAARLYQQLGFQIRRQVEVVFAQWHGADWVPEDPTESEG